MSGCITISPMGGLANRMRAILSARALAKDAGAQLRVLWNVSHELGCEPHWLFHTENWDFDWRTTTANTHHWLWKPAGKSNLFIPAVWQRLKFTQHIHDRTHLLNKSISTQQLNQSIHHIRFGILPLQPCRHGKNFRAHRADRSNGGGKT